MDKIELADSQSFNLTQIRSYFQRENIISIILSAKDASSSTPEEICEQVSCDVAQEMARHLNGGVENVVAIEFFFGASTLFDDSEIFFGKPRLFFRDRCIKMMNKWLAEEFDPNTNFYPASISKLFGTFGNFDSRMPDRLHHWVKWKLHEKVGWMNAIDGARVLDYYACTADFMPPDIFDAIVPLIKDKECIRSRNRQENILHDLAVIDAMGMKGIGFHQHSPKAVYDALLSSVDPLLDTKNSIKFRLAKKWFSEDLCLGESFIREGDGASYLSAILAKQGLSIQNSFGNAADPATSKGIDFVIKFDGAKSIGVIADTRSGYGSVIGQPRIIAPHGKSYLSSAFIERVNPDQVVVRILNNISRNMRPADLARALTNASNLQPGIYGVNSWQEVVALPYLSIAI